MKRVLILLALVAVLLSACGVSDGVGVTPAPSSAVQQVVHEDVAKPACGGLPTGNGDLVSAIGSAIQGSDQCK